MTKKEIVKQISEQVNETQLKTKEIVRLTFESIIDTLVTEGRIELRNFGVFEVKQRKPRKARNPRTGARVDVEAKNVVTFQPGKEMEERVRTHGKAVDAKRRARKPAGESHTPPVGVNGTAAHAAEEEGVAAVASAPAEATATG